MPAQVVITKQYDWLPPSLVGRNLSFIAAWLDVSVRYIKQLIYRSEGLCYECGKILDVNGSRCLSCRAKRRQRRSKSKRVR